MVGNNSFKVGMYIRLSRDDGNLESDSIVSQRSLLNQYVKENNYNLIEEYVDDGFTGTNFERPSFKRMIKDIKSQKVNTIIVMNVSRISRKNNVVDKILELHDKYNIDFISVNDNLDTINRSYTFELLSCFYKYLKNEDMIKRERLRRRTINMNREQRIRRKIVDIKSND